MSSPVNVRESNARLELVVLLVASLASAVMVTAGVVYGGNLLLADSNLSILLAGAIFLGAGGCSILAFWRILTTMRRALNQARADAMTLKKQLSVAEAVIGGEPQILILWDEGLQPNVVNHTLRGIRGLPLDNVQLVGFGSWLDRNSAEKLRYSIDKLLRLGRPFNMIIKTSVGDHLEADGRASSGRAVLRLRDIAGYKRDISRIIDGHEGLARDIRSSRALINALPFPVWLMDVVGRIIWVNKAYVEAVEAANEDEVIERQIELLEVRQRDAVARAIRNTPTFRRQLNLVTRGERRVHEVIVHKLDDASAAAAIDLSSLSPTQGERTQEVPKFDRILDRVSAAIAVFDADNRLSFFNLAYQNLWEFDRKWLKTSPKDTDILDRLRELGRLPEVVNYPEWRASVLAPAAPGVEREDWWHLPDGRILHVISQHRPDGGLTQLFVDETERLALESRFNELIGVQSETIDSLKEGVAVFATDGRLKLFNSAFATVWQLPKDKLKKSPHIDEIIADAETLYDDEETWQQLKLAITAFSDERRPIDGQMVRVDNSVIDYATMPLPDGATLITFTDVTYSKRYERALVERNEALVAADRLKSQFIGRVSYELRTPLTNIIGFTELLGNPLFGELTRKQREYVADITSSSRTLLSIIDGLIDLAAIDAGSLELKYEEVDVRELIDAAALGVHERAVRANLMLDIAIADDAKTFIADKGRVHQVLYHLLSNAVGFSPEGSTVLIGCWREQGAMVFQVEDSGIGIPEDALERVFEPFESHSRGSNHRGAGLGLAVVKNLVELHHGTISVESTPGAGTTVTVRLPEHGADELNQQSERDPLQEARDAIAARRRAT